ncbi:(d)CMP kinase [Candidatus Sumerlaeota bacterium]|nr:(d)CMP kinase [Candidatus Sumerlaeota bacterium]
MIDVVAMDGPVGVGKSSVAARLAARLGWRHLDTGAMYRAVALEASRRGVALDDEPACAEIARAMQFDFQPDPAGQRVILNGEDVTEAIRSHEINKAVSSVADLPAVREELGRRQREMGAAALSVAEGRDMGTVVFPDARWKFYLDADPKERAKRRGDQLAGEGKGLGEEKLAATIAERDRRDRERPIGALRVAPDAIVVDTTGMGMERVIGLLEQVVRGEMGNSG